MKALKKREKELQQHLLSLKERNYLFVERAQRLREDLEEMGIDIDVEELPQYTDDDEDTKSASTATGLYKIFS